MHGEGMSRQCWEWSPAPDEGSPCNGGIGGGSRGSLSDCPPFDAAVAAICQDRMRNIGCDRYAETAARRVAFHHVIECTVLCLNNLSDS